MADIKDVSTVIASALAEVSVNGTLDVVMDGEAEILRLGVGSDQPVDVVVTVTPAQDSEARIATYDAPAQPA